jgi:hypothetical protein
VTSADESQRALQLRDEERDRIADTLRLAERPHRLDAHGRSRRLNLQVPTNFFLIK